MIDRNVAAGGTAADRRLKAMLDQADPSRARREQARQMLEKLYQDETARTSQDVFNLAKLYLEDGNWSRARSLLRELVTDYPDEPRYVAAYVESLLNHDEAADAAIYLRRLAELAPNHWGTHSLQAAIHFHNGDYREALEGLKQFIGRADAVPNQEAARLRLVVSRLESFARRLEQQGQSDPAALYANNAEALYRRLGQQVPGQELPLAAFLARQDATDEAVTLLEENWEGAEPARVAQLASTLLESNALTPDQRTRAEKVVADALAKDPDAASLLMAMAGVRTQQRRYDDAEKYYRRILQAHPENVVALNNLAVLLALRGIKLDEARQMVDKAIALQGPVPTMLDSRATVLMALGRYDQAVADMNQAVADKASPLRLFHQAQAQLLAGQRRAARRSLQAALEKGLVADDLQPLEQPVLEQLRQSLQ
ncbi:MAG: tetratricopeptide repeat protein [Pirellulales bacterium]